MAHPKHHYSDSDVSTATTTATIARPGGDETLSLEDIEDGELIRCVNPAYEDLTWFYGFDGNGTLCTYHEMEGYAESRTTTRKKAESSIEHEQIQVDIVDRETLEEYQQGALESEEGR
ncbi:hypothetical protein [Natronosalvus amylolyticus]|uniref:hypothetical protein n=1 Tax=Natronosalvus amylolyticus TaxID=2961994 RepID=UPI0020C97C0D|nr:hypothetical protein [Natronosalvus amylolyticus]